MMMMKQMHCLTQIGTADVLFFAPFSTPPPLLIMMMKMMRMLRIRMVKMIKIMVMMMVTQIGPANVPLCAFSHFFCTFSTRARGQNVDWVYNYTPGSTDRVV